jgi:cobalt/nickel transport system permease protein
MPLPRTEPRARTFLHQAPPQFKLGAALIIITATVLMPRRPDVLYLAPAGVLLLLWPLCHMPLAYTARRMLVVEFFILGIALLSVLVPSARPVFLAAVIKSNLCVFTMLLLTWTTPFQEILQVLRRLRLAPVMLTTLALMYRYLPVLAEESRHMQRARASRTFSGKRRVAWKNLAAILGQLFVRSADRAERIYLAMCARGWK